MRQVFVDDGKIKLNCLFTFYFLFPWMTTAREGKGEEITFASQSELFLMSAMLFVAVVVVDVVVVVVVAFVAVALFVVVVAVAHFSPSMMHNIKKGRE